MNGRVAHAGEDISTPVASAKSEVDKKKLEPRQEETYY
jgi:hypothetical protein